jgi:hypothetical protein
MNTLDVLSYILGLLVFCGLVYFIYTRITRSNSSSGGFGGGGRSDGGPFRDN